MFDFKEINETVNMIERQHLDIRTITMGISLFDCAREDINAACGAIYDKICRRAEKLVATGESISEKYGIPIVNKRISVTPIAMVAAACGQNDYTPFAVALDKAAAACGVNFLGGFTALVHKGSL